MCCSVTIVLKNILSSAQDLNRKLVSAVTLERLCNYVTSFDFLPTDGFHQLTQNSTNCRGVGTPTRFVGIYLIILFVIGVALSYS